MMSPTPTDATIGGTGPRPSRREKMTTSSKMPTTARTRNETIAPQTSESPLTLRRRAKYAPRVIRSPYAKFAKPRIPYRTVRPIAATITMLLTTNPPMAYCRTMMPNTNESPPITATRMIAKTAAWMSCRRNRAVGRRAAHRERTRSCEDGFDPEFWAMVRSNTRGRSGTPLTFAAMEESLTIGQALSLRGSRSGRPFGGLRREAPRRVGPGGRERAWGGRGPSGFRSRGPRPAMVGGRAFIPCAQPIDAGYGRCVATSGADHRPERLRLARLEL